MKISVTIALMLSVCLLSACSSRAYSDELPCTDISSAITDSLDDGQEYASFPDSHIDRNFERASFDGHAAIYSADAEDISEIGVFHAKDKNSADALVKQCRTYIEDMQENSRAFIASYAPEELPKLDAAQVRRFGNYVVYTVLSEEQSSAAFESIKRALEIKK